MSEDNTPHVVNEDELEWVEESHDENVSIRRKQLGAAAGGEQLGCSFYELPPGTKSWPFHYHTANEEAIYVLDGEGSLRTLTTDRPLRGGDYVALPTGEDYARRVINSGPTPLRYLCISTMHDPEMSVFPDSEKVGLFAGAAPGASDDAFSLLTYLSMDAEVEYWEGERERSSPR